ncbi:GDT1-like protein 3 isoform X2 [Phragmites australis]|uniref:GDT1-like protein 3 isoform X2 n=1 Tax=Phragmites australis TaxID=29695 RepID=UPI002D76A066|nr:GDT1-like protein 3 isoform X2 [Phragmites australis]
MDPSPRAPLLLVALVAFLALAASGAADAGDDASGTSLGRRAGGFLHDLKKGAVVEGDHGVALDEVGPGLFDALFASLSMILVSEIGDETFIIAALMAMRHPKSIVLSGALSALYVMTVLSTGLGRIVPNLISRKHTNSAATVLYLFFGLRLLYIAWKSDTKGSQKKEMEEVEEKLESGQGFHLNLFSGMGRSKPNSNNRARNPQECNWSCSWSIIGAHSLHVSSSGRREHVGIQDFTTHSCNDWRCSLLRVFCFIVLLPSLVMKGTSTSFHLDGSLQSFLVLLNRHYKYYNLLLAA